MKIGVMGTGVVAQTMAEKLIEVGHQVMVGTRDPKATSARKEKDSVGRPGAGEWLNKHQSVKLGTYSEAAAFSEFIINATNGMGTLQALASADAKNLKGKVLLDISNPLDFSKGFPPTLFVSNTDSLAEQIQRAFPETHVVKSLNTMNCYLMVNPGLLTEDHTVFVSGNDAAVKKKVKDLLASFGWKEKNILDLGDLTTARGAEQLLPLWVRLYGSLQNPNFNFNVVIGSKI